MPTVEMVTKSVGQKKCKKKRGSSHGKKSGKIKEIYQNSVRANGCQRNGEKLKVVKETEDRKKNEHIELKDLNVQMCV